MISSIIGSSDTFGLSSVFSTTDSIFSAFGGSAGSALSVFSIMGSTFPTFGSSAGSGSLVFSTMG